MDFFGREQEIEQLRMVRERSRRVAQFTVVTGRRRIGKTSLILNGLSDEPLLYLFVTRTVEAALCVDFSARIAAALQVPTLGTAQRLTDIFAFLMNYSKQQPLTVVIDEFQDLAYVNASSFAQLQEAWDLNKSDARINLIVCGSANSMMNRIFRDAHEPLYGRQTSFMNVEPFPPSTLHEILQAHNPQATPDDLLALFCLTGGVAKYVELLMDNGAVTAAHMIDEVVLRNPFFIDEGRNALIMEFGRDYGRYFDILSRIAAGYNSYGQIAADVDFDLGGYLTRLSDTYGLIAKQRPIFQQSFNKNVHYAIADPFMNFWFRFIYKYTYMIEAGARRQLAEIVHRDYATYSGRMLELLFIGAFKEQGRFARLGSWWDRHGQNEIDIVGIDEAAHVVHLIEAKRQAREYSEHTLRDKGQQFMNTCKAHLKGYTIEYENLSLDDLDAVCAG